MNRYRHLPTYRYYDKEGKSLTLEKSVGKDLRDYKVYGNSVQDGTPTPDTPIEIESVGDKTKNIFNINYKDFSKGNCTVVIDKDTIVLTPNNVERTVFAIYKIIVTPNTDYTLSYDSYFTNIDKYPNDGIQPGIWIRTALSGGTVIKRIFNDLYESSTSLIFNSGNYEELYVWLYYHSLGTTGISKNSECQWFISNLQIKEGTTVDEYDRYGYKIPVKVRGKNWFNMIDWYNAWISYDSSNITQTTYKEKDCYLVDMSEYYNVDYILPTIKENTQYTLSAEFIANTGTVGLRIYYTDGTKDDMTGITSSEWVKYSLTSSAGKTIQSIRGCGQSSGNVYITNIQLEEGTTSTDAEPYIEPITTNIYLDEPLNGVSYSTSSYIDNIDFNNKLLNKKTKKIILTGNEKWILRTNCTNTFQWSMGYTIYAGFCTHYEKITSSYIDTKNGVYVLNTGALIITDLRYTTVDEFTDFLKEQYNAGTPVTCIVGSKTDIEPIEIDLPTISTYKGTHILELDTKIQPSNVFIQYYK